MAKKSGNSEVSVGYWMLALLVTALPLVNLIAVPLLAFSGSHATKKNYFRAILAWFAIILLLNIGFIALGLLPAILSGIKSLLAGLR